MEEQEKQTRWELLGLLLGTRVHEGKDAKDGALPIQCEKEKRKSMYDGINKRLDRLFVGEFAYFMNYGYIPGTTGCYSPVILPEHYYDRNSHQLVLEVIGDCAVDQKDILDVGCGRGGVAHVLQKHFAPKSYLGIDLSSAAIDFCRESHEQTGFAFKEGDAEDIPADDNSFDVVINIESSNCYPNIKRFFIEVCRVLKPGGWFLYTDILLKTEFDEIREMLDNQELSITRETDISRNVLAACEETAARRLRTYPDGDEKDYMINFLAAPGSQIYEALEKRLLEYRLFKIKR